MCKGNEIRRPNELRKIPDDFSKIFLDDPIKQDLIAQFTQVTKESLQQLRCVCKYIQTWKYYKLMLGKSQPAHVLTIASVLFVANLVYSGGTNSNAGSCSSWLKLVYLGCFAAHFGAQIWMTFVSGLALYFSLPRHIFGSVQKILFPKYFSINALLSLVTLCTFVKGQTTSDTNVFQVMFLVMCFLIELIIRLYLSPILAKFITIKTSMEKAAGTGSEIGNFLPGRLAGCPRYVEIHSKFRKVHMCIAIGNMLTMGLTFAHLHYLSNKICI